MTVDPWLVTAMALMLGSLAPAALLGSRGGPVDRLVGLELFGSVVTVVLLLLAQAFGQPSWLMVPLVLVPLSFAGTLVFTRLLAPGR